MPRCKFYRVVFRDSLKLPRRKSLFRSIETKNIPHFLAGPVMAGMCSLKDLYEDGLGLEFICDLNEMLSVKYENDYRAYEAGKNKK